MTTLSLRSAQRIEASRGIGQRHVVLNDCIGSCPPSIITARAQQGIDCTAIRTPASNYAKIHES